MNSRSFDIFSQILKYIIKYFKWVVASAVLLILLSGIYSVDSNEVAVVLRFGRLNGETAEKQIKQPGLYFSMPFFIDEVIKIPVQMVHEKEVITHYGSGGLVSSNVKNNGYLMTGDNNIVLIKAKIKYKIGNAAQYALYSCDSEKAIDGIVSGELTRAVTQMDIDTVLTSGKAELSSRMAKNSQMILDELNTGIIITNVELTEIIPPEETKYIFEEVINAFVNKETVIQKAREDASITLLKAESDANNYKQNAISKQQYKLVDVHGEIAEFNGVYDQYVKDPQIIINGTFRQRVSGILSRMGATVIVPQDGKPPIIVLP